MDPYRRLLGLSRVIKQLEPGYRLVFEAEFAKAAKTPQKGGKPVKKMSSKDAQAALKAKADPPDVPTPMSPMLKASLTRQNLKKPQQSPEELKASEAAAKQYSRKMVSLCRKYVAGRKLLNKGVNVDVPLPCQLYPVQVKENAESFTQNV
jgi:hypothetical protein